MIRPFAARQAEALSHGRYAKDLRDLAAPNETDDSYRLFTVAPAKALGYAHMFCWRPSYREPLPLSARLRGEREGPGAVAAGG